MLLQAILKKINGGFASGNNNVFENYTGNVAYYVKKNVSKLKENKVFYFTCRNSYFKIDADGIITFFKGQWLDGQFYGKIENGKIWNGNVHLIK